MIFVSVGTPDKPFNRLVEAVDRVAETIDEKVLIQTGYSTYIPKQCEYFRFCTHDEMLSYINDASVVISQAGFGIIGDSINLQKPLILVPREYKYGEAIDRQYELAEYLAVEHESIRCVTDIRILADAIKEMKGIVAEYKYKTIIPALIDKYISEMFFKDK